MKDLKKGNAVGGTMPFAVPKKKEENDRQHHVVMNDLHGFERVRHGGLLEIDASIVKRRLGRRATTFWLQLFLMHVLSKMELHWLLFFLIRFFLLLKC